MILIPIPLRDQLCTLEQAKWLQRLGIYQSSQFFMTVTDIGTKIHAITYRNASGRYIGMDSGGDFSHMQNVSAFGIQELAMILPPKFSTWRHEGGKLYVCENMRIDTFPLQDGMVPDEAESRPAHVLNKEMVPLATGRTMAEAMAAMAIHLIVEKYMSVDACNNRLLYAHLTERPAFDE